MVICAADSRAASRFALNWPPRLAFHVGLRWPILRRSEPYSKCWPRRGKRVKGLIIDEPWIGLILSGHKTWEMRKTACHHRGSIALIRKGSGQVVGTAEIVDSLPSIEDASEYSRTESQHRIPPSRQPTAFSDGWRTPWVLANAQRLAQPIAYTHPNGAVIWVNLDDDVSVAIEAESSRRGEQQAPLIEHPPHDPSVSSSTMDCAEARRFQRSEAGLRPELHYVVQRGKAAGTVLYPHVHADGCYVVSPSRFEKDYVRVRSIDEVKEYLSRGYSLRMSNDDDPNHRSPSLISPDSIKGWR